MSEEELFQQLNDNIRAEIAIHVNLDTLKKVKMFEHCDPGFLRELVLKLKPMLCSPGNAPPYHAKQNKTFLTNRNSGYGYVIGFKGGKISRVREKESRLD